MFSGRFCTAQNLVGRIGTAVTSIPINWRKAGLAWFGARFYAETDLLPGEPVSQEQKADLAASLQRAVEDSVIAMFGGNRDAGMESQGTFHPFAELEILPKLTHFYGMGRIGRVGPYAQYVNTVLGRNGHFR